MNNWLCINNGLVENVIFTDQNFIDTNPDIRQQYQQFLNKDIMPRPQPVLGSRLVNGTWVIRETLPLAGSNFSGQDLRGSNFSHCDLTGCNFQGARIDGCRFEWVRPTFSLVGAIWQGLLIRRGPVLIDNPYYYTLMTDVVAFVGCKECATGLPLVSTPLEKNSWDASADKPQLWWDSVRIAYAAQVAQWALP